MTHGRARALFVAGSIAAAAALAVAVSFALVPKDVAKIESPYVALANVASLRDGVPFAVTFVDDYGLDVKAREARDLGGYRAMGARPHQPDLPVWLVKTDGEVRAFIALDPRNSCRLELLPTSAQYYTKGVTVFHDICHGSIYGLSGEKRGGPTPWSLDQLVVSIRAGIVYADRHIVIPGTLAPR